MQYGSGAYIRHFLAELPCTESTGLRTSCYVETKAKFFSLVDAKWRCLFRLFSFKAKQQIWNVKWKRNKEKHNKKQIKNTAKHSKKAKQNSNELKWKR